MTVDPAVTPETDRPVEGPASISSMPGAGKMRAIIQDACGSSDVLRSAEIDRPEIAANEVLVAVAAAGMDRGTWHLMAGKPFLMRIIGFGFRRPNSTHLKSRRTGGLPKNIGAISAGDSISLKDGQDSDDSVRSVHVRDLVLLTRRQLAVGSGSS